VKSPLRAKNDPYSFTGKGVGLIMQVIKEVGDYNIDFITKMQDLLLLVGFSTDKVMEIMTQHLNPDSSLFNSPGIQGALSQNSDNSYEYN
jgi:hypothetical protein